MWMAVSQRKTQFRDLAVPNRFGLPLEQLQSQCHGLLRVGPIPERMHANLNDANILIHLTMIPVAATKILEDPARGVKAHQLVIRKTVPMKQGPRI